jgi:protein-S-isoprenylcysteine O-methyltransferase Ste14
MDEQLANKSVHRTLAKSYLVYFILCSLGLFLGVFFPMQFFIPHSQTFAVIGFILGPVLIIWAQTTSHRFELTKQQTGTLVFNRGPYRFLRNPTQFGLVMLVAGYAFASHTAILFVITALAYVISNVFFRKHEQILESRYGEPYKSYKSSVPKIM